VAWRFVLQPQPAANHGIGSTRRYSLCMNPYTVAQYQAYRQTEAQTASPTELVVMLYRGAVRFAKAGIDGVNRKDIQAANNGFVRAQQIVTELNTTLDMERGGAIASQLRAIYSFVNRLLMQANIQKAAEPAEQAIKLLDELLAAWVEVNRAEVMKSLAVAA